MPRTCAAFGCSNNNLKAICNEKNISFHLFPLKRPECKQWLIKLRRKDFVPTEYSLLCSEHFTEDCFTYQPFTNRRGLKPGAIPTLFSFSKMPKRKQTSHELRSVQTENKNLKKRPGRKRKKQQSDETVTDRDLSAKCLKNQKTTIYKLDEKNPISNSSECLPSVSIKVEKPCEEEFNCTPKPYVNNSQVCDKLQIKIKEVRSVSSAFLPKVDGNKTEASGNSSIFKRPFKIHKREEIFGKLVASELSDLCINPELYLKTKQAVLDILVQAHFEQIKCSSIL